MSKMGGRIREDGKVRRSMRPIEFRAWDEQKKVMHNDFQFVKSGEEGNDWILFVSDKQPISDYEGWVKNPYFQEQLKIMQFTGLKDKNGKKIFEGDICKRTQTVNKVELIDKFYYVVEFESGSFISVDQDKTMPKHATGHYLDQDSWEVIGNIYENPELLEEGK